MPLFNYQGYTSQELLNLCSQHHVNWGLAPWKYWPAEIYSFGRHIRSYACYPRLLPLYCYAGHGVSSACVEILPHELENDACVQLYYSPYIASLFKKVSDKPCYCVLAPFVWYRKKNNICISSNARGTLAFPSHSTPDIDLSSDIEEYIQELKNLPAKYQPVCVCLHMHDINKGQHHIFLKHGIPVYTAGNASDIRFAERWYDLIRNFRYTTSNLIGSYVLYSIEMGIPFFIYGKEPKYYNKSNDNLPKGDYLYHNDAYVRIYKIFNKISDIITDEQKIFAEKNLGVYDSVSRFKMAKILYMAYFKQSNIKQDTLIAIKILLKRTHKRTILLHKKIQKWFYHIKKTLRLSLLFRTLGVSPREVFKLVFSRKDPQQTWLLGKSITVNSAFWHLHGLEELFIDETYKFTPRTETPRIIDCGANIGLSAIYFKHYYPSARIVAIEPDPRIYAILQGNLKNFGYNDVETLNKAVWTTNESIPFVASGGVSGRIDIANSQGKGIPAVRLQDLLLEEVDFLKIDIEGAEYEVIKDCAGKLTKVNNLFIEYHSQEKDEQKLDEILHIVKQAGFKYYIKEAWNNQPRPYTNKRSNLFDLQLNIFGYRKGE